MTANCDDVDRKRFSKHQAKLQLQARAGAAHIISPFCPLLGQYSIMGRRQDSISKSILNAIFRAPDNPSNTPPTFLARIFAFFSLFQLALARYRPDLFK